MQKTARTACRRVKNMVQKNEILTGKVQSFGSDGEGVVRVEDCVFFVPYALPGEEISFRVLKIKGNTGYGKIENILTASPRRRAPVCPVFSTCGGCCLQHAEYDLQREFKREKVASALKKIGGIEAEVLPVVPYSSPYEYRNKLQLPVGVDANGNAVLGFYAERSHRIVPIGRCALHPAWAEGLMKAFKEDYDTPVKVGKRVAIVGGGNVAMDAARTALRLGAESHIVYRRSESELPARQEEVHHAKEEGVVFDILTNPVEILSDENGWVKGIKCVKMELGEADASGRRRPVPIEGSEFVMDVDTVIMSLGTSPNPLISSTTDGLETNKWKCLIADEETGLTTKEGVYAGGDAVTGAATVILAMGAGKKAAKAIDEYLQEKIAK